MPFTYHIEDHGYIVHVVGTEEGSLDSARNTFADLIAEPHLHRPFGLLVDVRALHNVPSREEAFSLSKFARVEHDESNHFTALLVDRGIQYGMARMIQMFSQMRGAKIEVFTNEQSVQYWLWEQLQFGAKSESAVAKE